MNINQEDTKHCLNPSDQKLLDERLTQQQKQLLKQHLQKTKLFIKKHQQAGNKKIILLTSGGTSVPLQKNTVRMIQNFSTGTRGSLLAAQILQQQYPLIYFYRDTSFLPYMSGVTVSTLALSQDANKIQEFSQSIKKLKQHEKNILLLPFKTIYLYLKSLFQLKKLLPQKSIILLCAAVSDFIPEQISLHKIHTQDCLQLKFRNSPKILGHLSDKRHLTVSFKLETDEYKVNQRMNFAIKKYNVDMVIGNILNNKNWIKITFNPNLIKGNQIQSVEFSSQIQKNIIKTVIKCLKLKYHSQDL